jgi:hypothetical protein
MKLHQWASSLVVSSLLLAGCGPANLNGTTSGSSEAATVAVANNSLPDSSPSGESSGKLTMATLAASQVVLTPTSGGSITDSTNNIWTLSSAGDAIKNGVAVPDGAGTSKLTYVVATKTIWGQDGSSGQWYSWNGSSWVGPTSVSPIPAAPTPTPTPIPTPPPVTSIRVAAGATAAFVDSLGNTWSADRGFTGGTAYVNSPTIAISNTRTSQLYNSQRYGAFTYSFPIANGTYAVTLKFAEEYVTGPNQRLFNVAINGSQVLSNFDVFGLAGAKNLAADQTFVTTVTGGVIQIAFSAGAIQNPMLNAIQIVPSVDSCQGGTKIASVGGNVVGSGFVDAYNSVPNQNITSLSTTLTVPSTPPPIGTTFLWPGLQPVSESTNFAPIDNGVLQPVLTWGPACSPNGPTPYSSWWISGQYVNTIGHAPGFMNCQGGAAMNVNPGDKLEIKMSVSSTGVWTQTIKNVSNGKQVSYGINMQGQGQNRAEFAIERYSGASINQTVEFSNTSITYANRPTAACQLSQRGASDSVLGARLSVDGKTCCYSRILLKQ